MSNNEINIKSTTIEKGLELAKDFLGKLISPTLEEIGLLLSDNIKFIRYKNQIKILLKAKEYVEKKNIKIKEIPIKILVPLLENASLEDDEDLQDKWAKMLTNMVNSEYNLQNQIFPYLLSQISIEEFEELKRLSLKEIDNLKNKEKLRNLIQTDQFSFKKDTKEAKKEVEKVEQDGFLIYIEGFESSNLERLGLIRQLPPKILIEEFRTGNSNHEQSEEWHQLDVKYDSEDFGYRITELGEKFLNICKLK